MHFFDEVNRYSIDEEVQHMRLPQQNRFSNEMKPSRENTFEAVMNYNAEKLNY